ncbi:MAG: hypothetical protein ACFFG0_02435 [Candidatus Thorarchaeota archaeon]
MITKLFRRKSLKYRINILENQVRFLNSLVKIGIDHHIHDDSWAVFCLAGNPEYVEFFRLKKNDLYEMRHFFKQFERGNMKVDTPPHFKNLF